MSRSTAQPSTSTSALSTSADNAYGEPAGLPETPGACLAASGTRRHLERLITQAYPSVPVAERRRLKAVALKEFASPDHPLFDLGLCVLRVSLYPSDPLDNTSRPVVYVAVQDLGDSGPIERLKESISPEGSKDIAIREAL